MTLTIDPATGAASGELPCSHPISALRQRTRFGENYAHWFCNECEAIVSRRTDRERHLAALRAAPKFLREQAGIAHEAKAEFAPTTVAAVDRARKLADSIEAVLPELERGAPGARELPATNSIERCIEQARSTGLPTVAAVASTELKLLYAAAPSVEAPAQFPSEEECYDAAARTYNSPTFTLGGAMRDAIRAVRSLCLRAKAPAPAETAGEFPSEGDCVSAYGAAYEAPKGSRESAVRAVRKLCLASRAPKVTELSPDVQEFRDVLAAGLEKHPGRIMTCTATIRQWRAVLSLIEGSEKP